MPIREKFMHPAGADWATNYMSYQEWENHSHGGVWSGCRYSRQSLGFIERELSEREKIVKVKNSAQVWFLTKLFMGGGSPLEHLTFFCLPP